MNTARRHAERFRKIGIPLAFILLGILAGPVAAAAKDLTVKDFKLGDFRGKVVYLDFWASWCGPCRATFPLMNELQAQYGEDLKVIAVNLDKKRSDAQRFLKKHPASFSILYDPEGKLATEYQLQGMPSSYFFDRQGVLTDTHVGFRKRDGEVIREKIKQLVDRVAPSPVEPATESAAQSGG